VLENKVDGIRLVVRVMRGQVKWGVEDTVLDLVISEGAERGKAKGVGGLSLVKGVVFVDGYWVEADTTVGGRGVRWRSDVGRRGWGAEAILVLNFLFLYLGGASRGFRAWYDAINPGANTLFDGSHVLSLVGYPLHLTRYCSLRRWMR
jgi:hypothetical protein